MEKPILGVKIPSVAAENKIEYYLDHIRSR